MRILKKICALIYLLAAVVTLGCAAATFYVPLATRLSRIMVHLPARIAAAFCAGIVALGVLICVIRLLVARREPSAIYANGNPQIQVSTAALISCARAAAQTEDIMVEQVRCRIVGADRSQAHFTVDAIAFTQQGLAQLAGRVEARVQQACEKMLGASGVTVRVRFLPSKTTVVQGGAS